MESLNDLKGKVDMLSESLDKVTQMFNWVWHTAHTLLDWISIHVVGYIGVIVAWLVKILVIAFDFLAEAIKHIAEKI